MGLAYFLAFPLFPVAAAALFPGMVVYGAYVSAQAAVDVVNYRGALGPAWERLRDGVGMVRGGSGAGGGGSCARE